MNQFNRFFVVIFLLFSGTIYPQIPGLTQFTTNKNLPSNTIYDIIQDESGFIWFATDYGISKFDGLKFTNYTSDDGLPGNEILFFYRDSSNRVWMSSFNGEISYLEDEKIINSNKNPVLCKLSFAKFVKNIYEDDLGNIWFVQDRNDIRVLRKNGEFEKFSIPRLNNYRISGVVLEDINNNIHILANIKDEIPKIVTRIISKKNRRYLARF